jgi:acetyl esterase
MTRHLLLLAVTTGLACAQITGPDVRVYKTVGTTNLTAHIFRPAMSDATARPAIVLFHGGGWVAGSPDWVYDAAKRYAGYGAVAVAVEYRLSDEKTITPLDAIADARDTIRWMRRNAAALVIQPDRIAGLWSLVGRPPGSLSGNSRRPHQHPTQRDPKRHGADISGSFPGS